MSLVPRNCRSIKFLPKYSCSLSQPEQEPAKFGRMRKSYELTKPSTAKPSYPSLPCPPHSASQTIPFQFHPLFKRRRRPMATPFKKTVPTISSQNPDLTTARMKYFSTRLWRATATPTFDSTRWTSTLFSYFASGTNLAASKFSVVDGVLCRAWRQGQSAYGRPSSSAFTSVIVSKATCIASHVKKFMASPTININWPTHTLSSGHKVVYPKIKVDDIWMLSLIWAALAALSIIVKIMSRNIKRTMGTGNQNACCDEPRNGNVQYEYSGVKMRTPIKSRDKNISGAIELAAVKDENGRTVGRRRKKRGVRVADRKMEKYEEAWIAKWTAMDD